jgi:hypothetical protein
MRNFSVSHRLSAFLGSVLLMLAHPTFAADDEREAEDPPERVARLSYSQGRVALQTRDDDDWTDASLNRPLTTGDRIRLDRSSRAELQAGALDLQLEEHSEFSFLELTEDVAQIQLTAGAVYVSIRRLRDNEVVEVDTPQAAVALTKPGEYTIAIQADGSSTLVRAHTGECQVTDHRQTVTLKSREQATFVASERGGPAPTTEPLSSRTAFENWARERNRRAERSASARYVDPEVIGYSDLDEYGDWVHEVEYGHVWYPTRIASDWSPYRHGRWVWISPWGWTWVDDAPWGFAPFHYGRWAHIRGRWCWVPGPLHVRPVYAPALVAWVGSGPPRTRVSVSIAFGGGIGWFPLAPREIYVPSYRCSRRYIHSVNYSNTVIVNNVYINRAYNNRSTYINHVNRTVHDAVTVMRPDAFTASRPVREHRVHVDSRDLGNWQTRNVIADVTPQRGATPRASWNPGTTREHGREREVIMRRTPQERIAPRDQAARGDSIARTAGRAANRIETPQVVPQTQREQQRREWSGQQPDRGSQIQRDARDSNSRNREIERAQQLPQTRAREERDNTVRFQNRIENQNRAQFSRPEFSRPDQGSRPEEVRRPQARGDSGSFQQPRQQHIEPRAREPSPPPAQRAQESPRSHQDRGREGMQPRQRFSER